MPEELRPVIREMAEVADRIAGKTAEVLSTSDATRAAEMERDDDAMDDLHRQLLAFMLGTAWRHGVEAAIDGALLGRFYERYADHAVNAGKQVIYLVTGERQRLADVPCRVAVTARHCGLSPARISGPGSRPRRGLGGRVRVEVRRRRASSGRSVAASRS